MFELKHMGVEYLGYIPGRPDPVFPLSPLAPVFPLVPWIPMFPFSPFGPVFPLGPEFPGVHAKSIRQHNSSLR